jgi:hypothetical protein
MVEKVNRQPGTSTQKAEMDVVPGEGQDRSEKVIEEDEKEEILRHL